MTEAEKKAYEDMKDDKRTEFLRHLKKKMYEMDASNSKTETKGKGSREGAPALGGVKKGSKIRSPPATGKGSKKTSPSSSASTHPKTKSEKKNAIQ